MVVGIVGLGLIGGSIGLALRKPGSQILGYDPDPKALEMATSRQCVDALVSFEEVAQADIVFVACPPSDVPETLDRLVAMGKESTVLTDCSSVKADAVDWAARHPKVAFVPGHPMAGHEKSGAAYASPWMFRGNRWILCALKHTPRTAVQQVESVIKEMGGVPVRMDPATHDRQVAIFSHLPHVLAGVLIQIGEELENADIAAGSWKDMTRVGGVDPVLWSQITAGNRVELLRVLDDAEARISRFRTALEQSDMDQVKEFFVEAAKAKAKFEPPTKPFTPPNRTGAGRKRRP